MKLLFAPLLWLWVGTVVSELNITDPKCISILDEWLRKLKPTYSLPSATLSVPWSELDNNLKESSCTYGKMRVELYRYYQRPNQKPWEKLRKNFNGCHDRPHMKPHDEVIRESRGGEKLNFHHIYEKDYVIRVCPCWELIEKDGKTFWRCGCKYTQNHCSNLIQIPEAPGKQTVAKVCQSDSSAPNSSTSAYSPPVVTCESALLSVKIPTCTPVQDYDQVQATFHPVSEDVKVCNESHHMAEGSVERLVPLHTDDGSNSTYGRVKIRQDALSPGTNYCLKLEVRNQPYCQGKYHNVHENNVKICNFHIKKPVRTLSNCDLKEPIIQSKPNISIIMMIIVTGIIVLISLSTGLILWWRMSTEEKPDWPLQEDVSQPAEHPQPQHAQIGTILLVYFPESEEFLDLNQKFKAILTSSGAKVLEFSEDNEDLVTEKEVWAEKLLSDGDTRVLIVDSPMTSVALRPEMATEKQPLLPDPIGDLRKSCINFIHAHFQGDFRKVCAIRIRGYEPISSVISDIVPHTRWTLPNNMADVLDWILKRQFGSLYPNSITEQNITQFHNSFIQRHNHHVGGSCQHKHIRV